MNLDSKDVKAYTMVSMLDRIDPWMMHAGFTKGEKGRAPRKVEKGGTIVTVEHSCWRALAGPDRPAGVSSAGGPRAAFRNPFIVAVFRPGRAYIAAGTAGWGRKPGHEQNTNRT